MADEPQDAIEEEEDSELVQEAGGWGMGALLLAGAIGFAVGAAMGVLFAPRPGEETRQELLRSAQENMEKSLVALRERVDALHQRLNEYLLSTDEIAQRLSGRGTSARPGTGGEEPEHLVES